MFPLPKILLALLLHLLAIASLTSALPASPTKPAINVVDFPRDQRGPEPTAAAAAAAADPSPSLDCHYQYCESSTSWCFFWAGVTGYDISLGPLPGESRTSLGACDPATAAPDPTTRPPVS